MLTSISQYRDNHTVRRPAGPTQTRPRVLHPPRAVPVSGGAPFRETGVWRASPDLTCFDATGRIASTITETLPGVFFDDIGVAPEGAVWVHGEQIAPLPDGALQ